MTKFCYFQLEDLYRSLEDLETEPIQYGYETKTTCTYPVPHSKGLKMEFLMFLPLTFVENVSFVMNRHFH